MINLISGQTEKNKITETNKKKCPAGISDCPLYKDYTSLKKAYQRLKQYSIRDELTGYYNHSFLITTLGNEMERTRRSGLSCCIILADIDYFKRINDNFGHECGNLALKAVTGLWKQNIRQVDYPCFTMILFEQIRTRRT